MSSEMTIKELLNNKAEELERNLRTGLEGIDDLLQNVRSLMQMERRKRKATNSMNSSSDSDKSESDGDKSESDGDKSESDGDSDGSPVISMKVKRTARSFSKKKAQKIQEQRNVSTDIESKSSIDKIDTHGSAIRTSSSPVELMPSDKENQNDSDNSRDYTLAKIVPEVIQVSSESEASVVCLDDTKDAKIFYQKLCNMMDDSTDSDSTEYLPSYI